MKKFSNQSQKDQVNDTLRAVWGNPSSRPCLGNNLPSKDGSAPCGQGDLIAESNRITQRVEPLVPGRESGSRADWNDSENIDSVSSSRVRTADLSQLAQRLKHRGQALTNGGAIPRRVLGSTPGAGISLKEDVDMVSDKIHARFWAKVELSPMCWNWTGTMRAEGNYGAFTVGRKTFSAPRFAWEMSNGPIPDGLWILHSCDNRRCVRPSHLSPGTQSQNISDCVARGRHVPPKGEKNGMSRLTAEIVAAIRAEYDGKRGTMTHLSKKYGASLPSIYAIIRRKQWK